MAAAAQERLLTALLCGSAMQALSAVGLQLSSAGTQQGAEEEEEGEEEELEESLVEEGEAEGAAGAGEAAEPRGQPQRQRLSAVSLSGCSPAEVSASLWRSRSAELAQLLLQRSAEQAQSSSALLSCALQNTLSLVSSLAAAGGSQVLQAQAQAQDLNLDQAQAQCAEQLHGEALLHCQLLQWLRLAALPGSASCCRSCSTPPLSLQPASACCSSPSLGCCLSSPLFLSALLNSCLGAVSPRVSCAALQLLGLLLPRLGTAHAGLQLLQRRAPALSREPAQSPPGACSAASAQCLLWQQQHSEAEQQERRSGV